MTPIVLGNVIGQNGLEKRAKLDLEILKVQNLLLQANSGGGKSWAIRRIVEQAFGKIPIIVIDPEGEFATLRQKYDFVLAARGGDTPIDVRSAALLAHKLLKLRVSCVCDLSELSPPQRKQWVQAFITALVNAPKELWTDFLIIIDEAHEFAPEKGHGESPAAGPLVDLAAKGRKRGFGTIAATQRLGKLLKDFAAELKNVMIGQTWIDIDRDRAAGALGVQKADRNEFFQRIKTLEPGNFFGLGRAIAIEATLIKVGEVETEHPTPGRRQSAAPPPTAKIKHMLPQLADLPAEAEEKLKTEAQLKGEITRLNREVAQLSRQLSAKPAAQVETKTTEISVVKDADLKRMEKLADKLHEREEAFIAKLQNERDAILNAYDRAAQAQQAVVSELGSLRTVVQRAAGAKTFPTTQVVKHYIADARPPNASGHPVIAVVPSKPADGSPSDLSRAARAILGVLAQRDQATDSQVSILSGYSITSSSFANALSELRTAGYMTGDRSRLAITDAGRAAAPDTPPLPTDGKGLLDYWMAKLGACERKMLDTLFTHRELTREQLSALTRYSITSSSFANGLSTLRTLELVSGRGAEPIRISETFA